MNDRTNNGAEGEEQSLPFGRESENQGTRRDTSDDAYAQAPLTERRADILALIKARPMTCDEIESRGYPHQSASASINWLMRRGHIVDSGERRFTAMGRKAIVWRYEPDPQPIVDRRPTRKELQKRVDAAIEFLETSPTNWISARIEEILRGVTNG